MLLDAGKAPNLKNFGDISDFILREQDYLSENEIEDTIIENNKSEAGKPNKMSVKLYVWQYS